MAQSLFYQHKKHKHWWTYLLVEIFHTSIAACVSLSVLEKQPEGFCQDEFRHALPLAGFAFGVQQNGRPYLSFALACNKDN